MRMGIICGEGRGVGGNIQSLRKETALVPLAAHAGSLARVWRHYLWWGRGQKHRRGARNGMLLEIYETEFWIYLIDFHVNFI